VSSPGDNQVEGGRALLRGRILGFPVHLDYSFVLIMGLFGYYPGVRPIGWVVWILITPLAVLVHELGHAVLARAAGAHPEIALAGFGGVTTYTPPGPLSRARSLGISLAGPGVGLAIGVLLLVLKHQVWPDLTWGTWQYYALEYGIWTCIGWSVLNLLPILPLDGGQAMRELLPGAPDVRARRAAMVSIPVALVAALIAYEWQDSLFLPLFLVLFAVTNWLSVRGSVSSGAPGASGSAAPAPRGLGGAAGPEHAIVDLLWRGQPAQARQLLESMPPGRPVDLVVHGAVLALTGDPAQGHALLDQELQRRPGDTNAIALLMLTQILEHDWDAVIATLQGPLGPNVPPSLIGRAITEARGVGREDVAGRLQVLTDRPG
jgi:Zn-dependent protease